MAEMRKRTSMSVPEMGRMLGLGKTESYWLIKKNYFKTILVGNTMRVMIDSFEEWYANQFKYQKVDGTPPGEELKKTTYSMEELGQRLGLKEATAYELVAKGHFDVVDVLGKRRVTKESFERWYASQTDYRTVEDQELDADIMASTYGLPEMARMLGVHRQTIYYIVANEDFELIKVGRYKRATKESFENGITIRPATSWRKIDRKGADYMASIVKRKRSILWFIHTPMRTATSVRSGKPLKRMPKQRKGSCRLNMSRSPEPLFPLLLKPSMIFWMSICQSMV